MVLVSTLENATVMELSGVDIFVMNQFALMDVVWNMDIAQNHKHVSVRLDGKELTAMNVLLTLDATSITLLLMELVKSLGSACA